MRKTIILGFLLVGCASCVSLATSHEQSWDMVQSVGGLRVGNPITQADGTVFLPVICNVSGLETITVKPTMLNSALVVREIAVKCGKDRIQIRVVTCVVDNKHTPYTKGVDLGRMKDGAYQVEYLNPDGTAVRLREVEIKHKTTTAPERVAGIAADEWNLKDHQSATASSVESRLKQIREEYHLMSLSFTNNQVVVCTGMLSSERMKTLQDSIHQAVGTNANVFAIVK